jgi:hypothetical protein
MCVVLIKDPAGDERPEDDGRDGGPGIGQPLELGERTEIVGEQERGVDVIGQRAAAALSGVDT